MHPLRHFMREHYFKRLATDGYVVERSQKARRFIPLYDLTGKIRGCHIGADVSGYDWKHRNN